MATMHPARWEDRNNSRAELLMYRKLRDETPPHWDAVHSVGLTSHRRKPWAEIDFVLICDRGILCIEVKGGRVACRDGKWTTNDRPLKASPFEQAGTASAALFAEIAHEMPFIRGVPVVYAVAFPDVAFHGRGAGIEPEIVYDDDDLDKRLEYWIGGIFDYWEKRLGRDRTLSKQERQRALRWLAPNFDLVPSLRSQLSVAVDELVRLTQQQVAVLEAFEANDRMVVRGGAGTGKTVLAVAEARRLAEGHAPVLVCCRSPSLGRYLGEVLADEPGVDVVDLRTFMRDAIVRADLEHRLPDVDEADLDAIFVPELCVEALMQQDRLEAYAALVVDEAQDVLTASNLDVLDALLEGGLERGRWRFFLDHKQDVFEQTSAASVERLRSLRPMDFRLTKNCRNTHQVAIETAVLAAIDPDDSLQVQGPESEVRYYSDRKERPRLVASIVKGWMARNVTADDIVILGRGNARAAGLGDGFPPGVSAPMKDVTEAEEPWRPCGAVRYCDAKEFKGLEARAIIVEGAGGLELAEDLQHLYVSCSRAVGLLSVVLPIDVEELRRARTAELIGRLARRRERALAL